jgi:hypothetical protein
MEAARSWWERPWHALVAWLAPPRLRVVSLHERVLAGGRTPIRLHSSASGWLRLGGRWLLVSPDRPLDLLAPVDVVLRGVTVNGAGLRRHLVFVASNEAETPQPPPAPVVPCAQFRAASTDPAVLADAARRAAAIAAALPRPTVIEVGPARFISLLVDARRFLPGLRLPPCRTRLPAFRIRLPRMPVVEDAKPAQRGEVA